MIYDNDKTYPNASQIPYLLKKIQDQTSVLHLMPTEHVVDGDDKYLLSHLANGRFVIKPNITQQGFLYYGNCQGKEFKKNFISKYYPTGDNIEDCHKVLMLNNVRLEQFKLLIETFPLYELLDKGIYIPDLGIKFSIGNPYGLASAYGLPSPYINLTSSIDVAMFYATNRYDEHNDRFEPIVDDSLGIIYIFMLKAPIGQTVDLSTLGIQIFPRTHNTKQFQYVLAPFANFNDKKEVFGLPFHQNEYVSNHYSRLFDEGRKLQPTDDVLSRKIKSINGKIYEEAIDINIQKNPNETKTKNMKILEGNNITIIDDEKLMFSKSDLAGVDLESMWYAFVKKITPQNERELKLVEYLRMLPTKEEYRKYFNLNRYYEKR